LCDEDFAAIRACEGHRCTPIFADHTRRRGRRWCSMAMCGNRATQAAHPHRLRLRADVSTPLSSRHLPYRAGWRVRDQRCNPSVAYAIRFAFLGAPTNARRRAMSLLHLSGRTWSHRSGYGTVRSASFTRRRSGQGPFSQRNCCVVDFGALHSFVGAPSGSQPPTRLQALQSPRWSLNVFAV
jgi:hypothetical protein